MLTFIVLLTVGAVLVGAYVYFTGTRDFQVDDDVPSDDKAVGGQEDEFDLLGLQDPPMYGTSGSLSQVVVLPNGELGYRNGFDLSGNHF